MRAHTGACAHTQFLLFTVVTVCNVVISGFETEQLLPGEMQRREPLVNIFINPSIRNLVFCVSA